MVGYSQINRHFEVAEIEEHFRYRCRNAEPNEWIDMLTDSEAETAGPQLGLLMVIHSLGDIQPRPSLAVHWRNRPWSQHRQIVRRRTQARPAAAAAAGGP